MTNTTAFQVFVFGQFKNEAIQIAVKYLLSRYDRDQLETVYSFIKNETDEKVVAEILRDEIDNFEIDHGGHDKNSRHVMALLSSV